MRIAVLIEENPADDLFGILMQRLCQKVLPGIEICRCRDKKELLRGLQEHAFDLIYLNTTGGIQDACSIILKLRRYDNRIPVFFATEHWKHVEGLCDTEPITVIRKPFEKRVFRLFFAGKKAEDKTEDSFFEYFFGKKFYRIRMDEILYFESSGRNIVIHMDEGRCEHFIGHLDDVEEKLYKDGQAFVRSHQSYLIRRCVIRGYAAGSLYLKNDEILPVSQRRRGVFSDSQIS